MLTRRLFSRRTTPPRDAAGKSDPRAGAPERRRPAPMPRMRWYS